jgi:hypothetical protein
MIKYVVGRSVAHIRELNHTYLQCYVAERRFLRVLAQQSCCSLRHCILRRHSHYMLLPNDIRALQTLLDDYGGDCCSGRDNRMGRKALGPFISKTSNCEDESR